MVRRDQGKHVWLILFGLAAASFLLSWLGWLPAWAIERFYARGLFPLISRIAAIVADAAPFSWLDFSIVVALGVLVYAVIRRRARFLVGAASSFYLVFFWGWGLNYHRPALGERLRVETGALQPADRDRLAERAAQELNRLWPLASEMPLTAEEAKDMAVRRVERVVFKVDGTDWQAPSRIKRSFLANPWYRIAGVDGMFNPFGHEPLVVSGLLAMENPFLMSHELAHVRGVANEGEANLVALLATIASEDPRFQYSGWLHLWEYLGKAPHTSLDPGPRADLEAIRNRVLSGRIAFVSRLQSTVLDAHLKANAVPAGIHSYSEFVAMAIATESRWNEFR